MKNAVSVLAALALCLAVLPAAGGRRLYLAGRKTEPAVTQYLGECETGDEYISGDNLHYRVVSVDPQAKTAQLELLGDADMPDVSWMEMEQSLAVSATNKGRSPSTAPTATKATSRATAPKATRNAAASTT